MVQGDKALVMVGALSCFCWSQRNYRQVWLVVQHQAAAGATKAHTSSTSIARPWRPLQEKLHWCTGSMRVCLP